MDPLPDIAEPPSVPDDGPDGVVPREVELKLFVPLSSVARLWLHPLLAERAIGPLRIERIENRYFDTPERDLAQRRMALRLRRIGRRWTQTLKVAEADERAVSSRSEWEAPVAGPALELPALRATPFASIGQSVRAQRLLARSLHPVFTTVFRRESRLLRLDDGSEVEFAFDRGVIAAGRGKARRWLPISEVEIEIKRGASNASATDSRAALLKFAARLARDVALIPLSASKAARGYRVADHLPLDATRTHLPEPHGNDVPRHHLARVLAASNQALLANVHALFEVAVVQGGSEVTALATDGVGTGEQIGAAVLDGGVEGGVEFVHQARVAVRRMRSAIRTFRPVAGGRRFEALDQALRTTGRIFGEARDWDVFMTTTQPRFDDEIGRDAAGRAALLALRTAAASRRVDARRTLMNYLDAGAFGAIAIAIERTVERLQADGRGAKDGTLATRSPAWLSEQSGRVTSRSRRIAVLDAEQRHGLRVEVKRLRYALDLLEALFDRSAVKNFHRALAELQDKLGKLNDAVVAATLLRALAGVDGHDLAQTRFDTWLQQHVRKQLPRVAALSVDLELTRRPWLDASDGDGVVDPAKAST